MDKEKLMKELIADEGFEYEIYLDHLGYPTLGVGHLITEKDEEHGKPVGTPISEQRIRECLDQDIEIVCSELDRNEPWWRNLDDNRQRILANMCFNLGYPRLSNFKRFIAAVQTSQWETAAREMMDSKWSGQVGDRAKRLRDRMLHSA
jgi:lysozyme